MASRSARITLSIGRASDGPRVTGDINILGLLLALYQAWVCIAILGAPKTFSSPILTAGISSQSTAPDIILTYAFTAFSAVSLILIAILDKRAGDLISKRAFCLVTAALCSCACILLILFGGTYAWLEIICGCMSGIGTAFFICVLGRIYAPLPMASSVVNTTLSLAIGYILSIALVSWLPTPIVAVIVIVLPLAIHFSLIKRYPKKHGDTIKSTFPDHMRPYLTRLGISSAIFGVALGAITIICVNTILLPGDLTTELVFGAGAVVSMLVFILAMALYRHETSWDSLFRIAGPFIAAGIAAFAFCLFEFSYLGSFAISFTFVCAQALFWIFLASMSHQLNFRSDLIFGLGYGLLQVGFIAGIALANLALGTTLDISDITLQRNVALLALLIVAAVFISYSVFPRYSELRVILAALLLEKANEKESAEENTKAAALESVLTTETTTGNVSAKTIETSTETPREDSTIKTEEAAEETSLSLPEDSKADTEDSFTHEPKFKGSFTRRCEQIAEDFLLSDREKEVLFLLAKGHNAAFILEKLCISRSTAKTHINHIYKKMNIHTQQELLNMVEDRERGSFSMRYGEGPSVGSMGAAVLQDQKALREAALAAKQRHESEMAKAQIRRRS